MKFFAANAILEKINYSIRATGQVGFFSVYENEEKF